MPLREPQKPLDPVETGVRVVLPDEVAKEDPHRIEAG
jgi:hypothetical protein